MRVHFGDFINACTILTSNNTLEAGFCDGLLAHLFRAFDKDMSGWLVLRDWDEKISQDLVVFQTWVRGEFGGIANMLRTLEDTPDGGVGLSAFVNCKVTGLNRQSLETLFEGLCMKPKRKASSAILTMEDLAFLDSWQL